MKTVMAEVLSLLRNLEVPGANLGPKTGYTDCFSLFFSVPTLNAFLYLKITTFLSNQHLAPVVLADFVSPFLFTYS
jgi:hypothetical protein